MNTYQTIKEKIREEAIEWQFNLSEESYSYSEIFDMQTYFLKKGRKYGLLKEFKENGII